MKILRTLLNGEFVTDNVDDDVKGWVCYICASLFFKSKRNHFSN